EPRRGRASVQTPVKSPARRSNAGDSMLNVGFKSPGCNAAEADAATLRPLQGLERADFPDALFLLAGFALHPGLRAALDIARQEIPAGLAVLGIGRGDRGDGAACAGARIFPGRARVFAAAGEYVGGGGPRIGQIAIG